MSRAPLGTAYHAAHKGLPRGCPDVKLDATLTDATVDLIETATDVAIRIGALVDSTLVEEAGSAASRTGLQF